MAAIIESNAPIIEGCSEWWYKCIFVRVDGKPCCKSFKVFNVAWGNICYNWWQVKQANIESTELYPKNAENKAAVGGILTQYRS